MLGLGRGLTRQALRNGTQTRLRHSAARTHGAGASLRALELAAEDPLKQQTERAWAAAAVVAGVGVAAYALNDDAVALNDKWDSDDHSKQRVRRHLMKFRTQHRQKLDDENRLKIYLDEYKQTRIKIDSLATRFQVFASQAIETEEKLTPAMTFTDFLYSLILPRFRTRAPLPDVEYTCEFMGNANGLITFEECYLLIHLLQIPKEHFAVAFCMFDLDGDGSVDKDEFCDVIENLLRAISTTEGDAELMITAEEALPRLVNYFFSQEGKKIRAEELEAVLDLLRKQILKAEFDLYARPHPKERDVQVLSVHDFAVTLLSCFDPDRLAPYVARLDGFSASDEFVTWDDFYKFHTIVQSNLEDIRLAFDLTKAEEITEADFIHAVRVVSNVELPLSVVQLAFRVFDSDGNGTLDHAELLKVLEVHSNVELQQRPVGSATKRFLQCIKGPVV
ncbi:hypothetical protein Poli38472_001044 [Pythium oligandrum]|uniref:EF-hand domain-containing protein n=1 Tax=Pythium oligandrum TaxID=41045 RepID=A0A8K1CV92_PYTOL|nr:hypothetical protein Poli38472_001044 [Pythium oligandrum]|eukprot:TMW68888.1 hypothetical protein Poli38472_001044 [Pythium oligandrum]